MPFLGEEHQTHNESPGDTRSQHSGRKAQSSGSRQTLRIPLTLFAATETKGRCDSGMWLTEASLGGGHERGSPCHSERGGESRAPRELLHCSAGCSLEETQGSVSFRTRVNKFPEYFVETEVTVVHALSLSAVWRRRGGRVSRLHASSSVLCCVRHGATLSSPSCVF